MPQKGELAGFPGGPVVNSLSCNAGFETKKAETTTAQAPKTQAQQEQSPQGEARASQRKAATTF